MTDINYITTNAPCSESFTHTGSIENARTQSHALNMLSNAVYALSQPNAMTEKQKQAVLLQASAFIEGFADKLEEIADAADVDAIEASAARAEMVADYHASVL